MGAVLLVVARAVEEDDDASGDDVASLLSECPIELIKSLELSVSARSAGSFLS